MDVKKPTTFEEQVDLIDYFLSAMLQKYAKEVN